jgi:tRNA nucleotidyltransferase (CCA-adding enzyme)
MNDWFWLLTEREQPGQLLLDMVRRHPQTAPRQLAVLDGIPQEPCHHPEGCALTHTCLVVDAMAGICDRESIVGEHRFAFLLAAVCHDFGKATTTMQKEKNGVLRWTSYGHDVAGVPMAREFLMDIGYTDDVEWVLKLVRWHMTHCRRELSFKSVRKLVRELHPASVDELLLLMEADSMGRGPASCPLSPLMTIQLPAMAREVL